MKKILYIGVVFLAFTSGIFITYIRPLFIPISLNELKQNPDLYKSREIKVKGYLIATKGKDLSYIYDFVDYKDDCPKGEPLCLTGATIELSDEVIKREKILIKESVEKNYQYQLENGDNVSGEYGAEIELTGLIQGRVNE